MIDWQAMVAREGKAVWRAAWRILGSEADADEVMQEVFLAALECSRRQEVRNWPALLRSLATSKAVDRLRRRQARGGRPPGAQRDDDPPREVPDASPGPPGQAEAAELADSLRRALPRLVPNQAEAFCLHCLEGWSYQEVSEQMGVSTESVGVLIHRARARLREMLSAWAEAR